MGEIEGNTADRHRAFEGRQAPLLFAVIVLLESDLRVNAARIPHAQFVLIVVVTDIPSTFIPDITATV
jgi:hypothetical protein